MPNFTTSTMKHFADAPAYERKFAPELRPQMAGVFADVLRKHCPEALQAAAAEAAAEDAAAAAPPPPLGELSKSLRPPRKGTAAPEAADEGEAADFRFSF